MSEDDDTLLFTAKNLSESQALRAHIMKTFYRLKLWLFVTRNSTGTYALTALSERNGRLSEGMMILLRDECQDFVEGFRKANPEPVESPVEAEAEELADEDYQNVDDVMANVGTGS